MSEERLHREVRRALDRGYRPLGAPEADRILRRAVAPRAGPWPDAGPWSGPAPNGRLSRKLQHGLAAVAAVVIASLVVATLLAVRDVHLAATPAGHGPVMVDARHLDALREAARAALASGRNDAAVASFLGLEGAFAGGEQVARLAARLEADAPLLDSADPGMVGRAAPDAERTADAIHAALLDGLPPKAIVVSLDAQELRAYDRQRLLLSTPVTTGGPATPTSTGPMRVLVRAHPYVMKSPWPQGSPNWYPETTVQYMILFSPAGDGLHDAAWQACCYGRGSQLSSYGTRGTVNVPAAESAALYGWADVGTPVVVVPGDGSPPARQEAAITVQRPFAPAA